MGSKITPHGNLNPYKSYTVVFFFKINITDRMRGVVLLHFLRFVNVVWEKSSCHIDAAPSNGSYSLSCVFLICNFAVFLPDFLKRSCFMTGDPSADDVGLVSGLL